MEYIGPPETVYVENEWYDGPRAGIADVNGAPHRFKSNFDYDEDDYLGTYLVWPVDEVSLNLEIEQWNIFIEWNALYESGEADTDSHPGHGGINQRWDELELLLKQSRTEIPADAKEARSEMVSLVDSERYGKNGPGYKLRWSVK